MAPIPGTPESPHVLSVPQALDAVDATLEGLQTAQASERLHEIGPNELPASEGRSITKMILDQFKDFLIILLLVRRSSPGSWRVVDTIAILVIVVLNAVIGVVQEYRAERAMEALKRDGGTRRPRCAATAGRPRYPRRELTVGDIVLLDAGRVVPADLRMIESASPAGSPKLRSPASRCRSRRTPTSTSNARRTARRPAGTWLQGHADRLRPRRRRRHSVGLQTEIGRIADLLASARTRDAAAEASGGVRQGSRNRRGRALRRWCS